MWWLHAFVWGMVCNLTNVFLHTFVAAMFFVLEGIDGSVPYLPGVQLQHEDQGSDAAVNLRQVMRVALTNQPHAPAIVERQNQNRNVQQPKNKPASRRSKHQSDEHIVEPIDLLDSSDHEEPIRTPFAQVDCLRSASDDVNAVSNAPVAVVVNDHLISPEDNAHVSSMNANNAGSTFTGMSDSSKAATTLPHKVDTAVVPVAAAEPSSGSAVPSAEPSAEPSSGPRARKPRMPTTTVMDTGEQRQPSSMFDLSTVFVGPFTITKRYHPASQYRSEVLLFA